MKIAAAILDLDGTLLDTLPDIAQAMNSALREFGMPPHSDEAYRQFVGGGAKNLAERALPPGGQIHTDKLLTRYQQIYGSALADKTKPYLGIEALLTELTRRQIHLAVLSNKPDAPTQRLVELFFAHYNFAVVQGERPDVPKKPDPHSARAIAQKFAVMPNETLFLGDSSVDIECAKAAGMIALGAGWGFRGRDELVRHGAMAVFESPFEIIEWLAENAPQS